MKTKSFIVGGLTFHAIRHSFPINHWRLQLPSGEVWEPGTGGISGVSVPKMQADLEYVLNRFGKERFILDFGQRQAANETNSTPS